MKAILSNYKQSPRKVRLVANLVRGKNIARAKELLAFADKKSASAFQKLLNSAVASAREKGAATNNLFIKEIQVNQGLSMVRFMPQARGSAHRYRHRRSSISIVLGERKPVAKTSAKKVVKKTAKKLTPKN